MIPKITLTRTQPFQKTNHSILISLIVGLLSLFCGNVSAQVGQNTDLWKWSADATHHRSIVQIESSGGVGAGVIIHVDREKPVADGFQGWALTAWHVVSDDEDQRQIKIKYYNGRSAKQCKVLAYDKEFDVALLWVWVPSTIEPIDVASNNILPKEQIEIAGLGGGSQLTCCLRHFDTTASVPTNGNQIFADVTLLPGDSGGPVFNSQKQVCGIVSGGWFWWDSNALTQNGQAIHGTWPARTCNVGPIQKLLDQVAEPQQQFVSR